MRPERVSVVCATWLVLAGCANAHRTADAAAPSGAGTQAASPVAALDAADLGPAPVEAANPDVQILPPSPSCPLVDSQATPLTETCAYTDLDGTPCESGSLGCSGYRNVVGAVEPDSVCNAECRRADTSMSFVWSVSCGSCRRTCGWPAAETPTYDVEHADCARRTPTACPAGALTVQDQVDSLLGGLIADAALDLIELKEDHLVVHFEDGCATAFHGHFQGGLTMLAPPLRALLADVRWECAEHIDCAQVMGPSTLP